MGLFGYDKDNRPSAKKILLYCVVISAVLLLLGYLNVKFF
jgi:hypothetical protein